MAYHVFATHIELSCDVCGKTYKHNYPNDKPVKQLRYAYYLSENGYRFYAMTCSDVCQTEWEKNNPGLSFAEYVPFMGFNVRIEVPIGERDA